LSSSTYTNKTNGALIDYYEIDVKRLQKQIYPNLPATQLIGYDGLQPGPTFIMRKGRGKLDPPSLLAYAHVEQKQ
jgi:bilirubin oxidase